MSHPLMRADFDDEKRRVKPGLKEAWGGKQGPGFVMLHSFTCGCFVGEISLHQEGYRYAFSFYCVPGSVRGTFPHSVS